jgi:hypothetical protein
MGTMEELKTWRLRPVLNVPDLYPPVVLFSILDADQRSKYKDALNRIKPFKLVSDPASPVDPQLMRQSQLSVAWDSVFHDVPGDRMGLLYRSQEPKPGEESGGSARGTPSYMVQIMSDATPGTKWLVTRATRLNEKPVCWCTPVSVEIGKTCEVALTAENMIVLEAE